jgi:hypothetical protein
MAVALGLAVRAAVVRAVAIEGPLEAPTVTNFGRHQLECAASLTPHADFMRASLEVLQREVVRSERDIAHAAAEAVTALLRELDSSEPLAVIGTIIPRCLRVDDLRRRVVRRAYADCADGHLVSGAVAGAARSAGVPVMEISGVDALRGAERYFGLDRQALGQQAKQAQGAMGADFDYHHRLPTLAARIALAAIEAGDI